MKRLSCFTRRENMMIEIDEIAQSIILVARGGLVGTHATMFATGDHSSHTLVLLVSGLWCLEEVAGMIEQRSHVKKHIPHVRRFVTVPRWLRGLVRALVRPQHRRG
jgi:hypothetical protein